MATDEPTVPETPPTPAGTAPKRRGAGRVLLIVAIVLAGILVIGGGTALFVYDRATAIDRSNPEVVAGQFLRASLVDRDAARVSLFVCRQWSAQDAMDDVAAPTDERIVVSWGDYSSTVSGAKATVNVKVEFNLGVGSVSAGSVRSWRLDLEDQDGWRVCSLTKSLNP